MNKLNEIFIDNVRAYLVAKGWLAKDLAERAGMAKTQLSDYLTGKSKPSLDVIDRLAQALEVRPMQLFQEHSPTPSIRERAHRLIDLMDEARLTALLSVFEPVQENNVPTKVNKKA